MDTDLIVLINLTQLQEHLNLHQKDSILRTVLQEYGRSNNLAKIVPQTTLYERKSLNEVLKHFGVEHI